MSGYKEGTESLFSRKNNSKKMLKMKDERGKVWSRQGFRGDHMYAGPVECPLSFTG